MTTAAAPLRLPLVEYSSGVWSLGEAAARCGVDSGFLEAQVNRAQARVHSLLRSRTPRLECEDDGVRAEGFAGLLRLSPYIELEVAPKFLGVEAEGWREDFFAITTLTHFGRLLNAESLHSKRGDLADLATLVARALVELAHQNRRRPLRTYRRQSWLEFSADGVVEPEDVLTPNPDGFSLRGLRLTRDNPFNATIKAAALTLEPDVRDGDTRARLARLASELGPQSTRSRDLGRKRILPSRARAWQAVYDLACDVLDGFGVRYGNQAAGAPGYLLDTWRAWQDLVGLGVRLALPNLVIKAQPVYRLGTRSSDTGARAANVIPDFVVASAPPVVVDAKYKGRWDGKPGITEADLYEALAFLEAISAHRACLMYPAIPRTGVEPMLGSCRVFETIDVGTRTVVGVEVDVRGLSRAGGLSDFAGGLRTWFSGLGVI